MFLENLRNLREANNITQEEMAKKLNIKRSTYAYFEKNSRSVEMIAHLRDVIYHEFGYTLDELFDADFVLKEEVSSQVEYSEKDFLIDNFCCQLTQISKNLMDIKYELLL